MKKYIIIAGVNGAGKSTLYQLNDTLKEVCYVGKIRIGYFDFKSKAEKYYYIPVYVNVRNTPCMTIPDFYYY